MIRKLICLSLILVLMLLTGCRSFKLNIKAIDGKLDLSLWKIESGPVALKGEWLFYGEKLLKPRDFAL